jgi:hypothetical protein
MQGVIERATAAVQPPASDRRTIGGKTYEKHRRRCGATGQAVEVVAECRDASAAAKVRADAETETADALEGVRVANERFEAARGALAAARARHEASKKPPRETPLWRGPSTSPLARLEALMAGLRSASLPAAPGRPAEVQAGIDRLREAGRVHAAMMIEAHCPLPGSRGATVKVDVEVFDRVDPTALAGLIASHAAADHGEFNRADVELTDDMRWVPDLFDVPMRNAVALESGRGFVRSRYSVPPARGSGEVDVEIVTLLAEAGAMTVVWCPSRSRTRFE